MPRGESKRNSSPYSQNCIEWCGDEKVFFISQHFVPDSHGFASIGFDWTPLAHGCQGHSTLSSQRVLRAPG